MVHIVPDITSLMQYLSLLNNNSAALHPGKCPNCGKTHLWRHGVYFRQSDRINPSAESLNAISIQRYYCSGCKKTCSALPECIPPNRWHLWEVQQVAITALCHNTTLYAVAKEALPSRSTIRRWWTNFQNKFHLHKDTLCTLVSALVHKASSIKDFWLAVFKNMNLGVAMRLCHVVGVIIP